MRALRKSEVNGQHSTAPEDIIIIIYFWIEYKLQFYIQGIIDALYIKIWETTVVCEWAVINIKIKAVMNKNIFLRDISIYFHLFIYFNEQLKTLKVEVNAKQLPETKCMAEEIKVRICINSWFLTFYMNWWSKKSTCWVPGIGEIFIIIYYLFFTSEKGPCIGLMQEPSKTANVESDLLMELKSKKLTR